MDKYFDVAKVIFFWFTSKTKFYATIAFEIAKKLYDKYKAK